ncbi:MAG: ABC transporter ATP-binding protein [Caldisericia bacterium]|nr:ABC transporter ATP-binding protein [Caldisericia bacterium]
MLKLENISVEVGNKKLLHNINLHIKKGTTHILLGPNGSGKSTLLKTIIGMPKFKITTGSIYFNGIDITDKTLDERARMGIGLMFQNPPAVKGVTLEDLCEAIKNKDHKTPTLSYARALNLTNHIDRNVNDGFSGGEVKRSEVMQIKCQEPKLVLLDEPESGVDLDNIELIGKVIHSIIQSHKAKKEGRSGIIVTHVGYILKYLSATEGHIMTNGRLILHGDPKVLFNDIKKHGFMKKGKRL